MRSLSILVSLALLAGCAKAVHDNAGLEGAGSGAGRGEAGAAGAPPTASTSAGHKSDAAGTSSSDAAGRAGMVTTVTPPAADGGPPRDASVTPPQAGAPSKPDAGPPPERLCNGSKDMRLFFSTGGGFVWSSFFFTNPYGFQFLAIDGSCQFYTSSDYRLGIASGTLANDEEEELSKALHWYELDDWGRSARSDEACPDAPEIQLGKAKSLAACTCGCDADAPLGLSEALMSAPDWVKRLEQRGEKLAGPVSAVATSFEQNGANVKVVDWPLPRSISSIPNLLLNGGQIQTGPYARFEDSADAKQLRELRTATITPSMIDGLMVREAGKLYSVVVRDELPDDASRGIEALRLTWPKSP